MAFFKSFKTYAPLLIALAVFAGCTVESEEAGPACGDITPTATGDTFTLDVDDAGPVTYTEFTSADTYFCNRPYLLAFFDYDANELVIRLINDTLDADLTGTGIFNPMFRISILGGLGVRTSDTEFMDAEYFEDIDLSTLPTVPDPLVSNVHVGVDDGTEYSGSSGTVTTTVVGWEGELVEGSFDMIATNVDGETAATITLVGSFSVTRECGDLEIISGSCP